MAAVAGALRERCGGGAKVLFRRKSPRRPVNAETCAAVLWRDGSVNEEALLMHESITIDSSSDAPPAFRRVVTSTGFGSARFSAKPQIGKFAVTFVMANTNRV
jgi:hypothetical protein